jgi:hypothetical protein
MPPTVAQKAQIAQFASLTGTTEKTAGAVSANQIPRINRSFGKEQQTNSDFPTVSQEIWMEDGSSG